MMRRIDRQAMALVVITLIADQLSKQLLLSYLLKAQSAVVPALATGEKCARCWQVLEEVGKSPKHPLLCVRCEGAVESLA